MHSHMWLCIQECAVVGLCWQPMWLWYVINMEPGSPRTIKKGEREREPGRFWSHAGHGFQLAIAVTHGVLYITIDWSSGRSCCWDQVVFYVTVHSKKLLLCSDASAWLEKITILAKHSHQYTTFLECTVNSFITNQLILVACGDMICRKVNQSWCKAQNDKITCVGDCNQ